jgi:hypothetical protein
VSKKIKTNLRVKIGMSLAHTIDEIRTTHHRGGGKKHPPVYRKARLPMVRKTLDDLSEAIDAVIDIMNSLTSRKLQSIVRKKGDFDEND